MTITDKIDELFTELVPNEGKAGTVAGEIIRAISKIDYRNSNDGDHIGIGYGKETCNPAARYLMRNCGKEVAESVLDAWGVESDELYDEKLITLKETVLDYIESHSELKTKSNEEDMWDYRDELEDTYTCEDY